MTKDRISDELLYIQRGFPAGPEKERRLREVVEAELENMTATIKSAKERGMDQRAFNALLMVEYSTEDLLALVYCGYPPDLRETLRKLIDAFNDLGALTGGPGA